MNNILSHLNYIDSFSSLILVAVTIVYVVFTHRLSKETTKLREVETNPFMSLVLESFNDSSILKLTIKNIGKAPAYKISFTIDKEFKDLFKYDFENQISYFAPNQEITIYAQNFSKFEKLSYNNIPIIVKYKSKDGSSFKDTFQLEWKYLIGTLLGTNLTIKINKNLEQISKEIKSLNEILKNRNYTVTQRIKLINIDYEVNNIYVKFIFSNGDIINIDINKIGNLGFKNIENIYIDDNFIIDYSDRTQITHEELYYKLKKIR